MALLKEPSKIKQSSKQSSFTITPSEARRFGWHFASGFLAAFITLAISLLILAFICYQLLLFVTG